MKAGCCEVCRHRELPPFTDGAFAPDGTFIPLPEVDAKPFEKLWQQKVFNLLLRKNKIDHSLVTQMGAWRHSGFNVPSRGETRRR